MDDLKSSFNRVNEKYFNSKLRESGYSVKWGDLSGTFGRVTCSWGRAHIKVHEKLKGDLELADYVMLHEVLHTVRGFRGVRRHSGKFNRKMIELLGVEEFKRLEKRLHGVDIKKRVFRKRYVYECPGCGKQITRKKRIKNSSCAACDSRYNPSYRLVLKEDYSLKP